MPTNARTTGVTKVVGGKFIVWNLFRLFFLFIEQQTLHFLLIVAENQPANDGATVQQAAKAPQCTDFSIEKILGHQKEETSKKMQNPKPLERRPGESVKEYIRRNYFHNTRGEPTLDPFARDPEEKCSCGRRLFFERFLKSDLYPPLFCWCKSFFFLKMDFFLHSLFRSPISKGLLGVENMRSLAKKQTNLVNDHVMRQASLHEQFGIDLI